jgi:lipoic acid synthetase
VINHNIEVVEELFPMIRPQGDYQRSLDVLKTIKIMESGIPTKSGFMVGLGETTEQIYKTMHDLKAADADFLTIGQYLQPTRNHAEVEKYYTPEEFEGLKNAALRVGFMHVESGPLVRSSYHAQDAFR